MISINLFVNRFNTGVLLVLVLAFTQLYTKRRAWRGNFEKALASTSAILLLMRRKNRKQRVLFPHKFCLWERLNVFPWIKIVYFLWIIFLFPFASFCWSEANYDIYYYVFIYHHYMKTSQILFMENASGVI